MTPLISGLILAAVSALAVIAYRHPKEYRRIYTVLLPVLAILFCAVGIWNASAEIYFYKAYAVGLSSAQITEAKKILSDHQLVGTFNLVVTNLLALGFLYLLRSLPELGIVEKKPKKEAS